jgi:tetratricopeptide (TPR) repeat protein
VRAVREALEARGVRVWMDERQILGGARWMEELQEIIVKARSAAVFLGKDGLGRWQKPEIEACIDQNVERNMPVIPVPLPGLPDSFEIQPFLKRFSWADLRAGLSEDFLERLTESIPRERTDSAREETPSRPSHGPRLHNLPFLPLKDLFKGRDDALRVLETNLHGSTSATAITQTQAIQGLGGIGKTRLAVEYAWRSGNRYAAALFVVAESPEALRSNLADLPRLGLPGLVPVPSHTQEEEVTAVLVWLREHDRWLLILDNVDSDEAAEAVRKILPQLQGGHVLITSRRRNWPASIRKQPLDELGPVEATAFLLQRTDVVRTSAKNDPEQARRLAEILDGLPLALEQAAAYIAHHQMSFSAYLGIWEKERESVLDWHDRGQMDYPASVATTWQTTFHELSPTAAAILRLTAYLAPDPILLDMFENGANYVEEGVSLLREEIKRQAEHKSVREGVAELGAYSMITREDRTFSVHRMLQEVLRTRIPEERRSEWIERALRLVNDFSPLDPADVRTWPVWNVLRPHAAVVVRYADEARIAQPTAQLMNQLEEYLRAKGLYTEAEPMIRRALASVGEVAPDSSEYATWLNHLDALIKTATKLSEAELLMRSALDVDEDTFGPDHPNVAVDLTNLAQLLQDMNRFGEAEPLLRRVMAVFAVALGPKLPRVATVLNNLGRLLHQATNRLAEAEPLMRRALKIDQDTFGQDHPNVARDLDNLAQLLQAMNRSAEAEPLMRRAVKILEASLGPDHSNTRKIRRNLENLLAKLNPEEPQQA